MMGPKRRQTTALGISSAADISGISNLGKSAVAAARGSLPANSLSLAELRAESLERRSSVAQQAGLGGYGGYTGVKPPPSVQERLDKLIKRIEGHKERMDRHQEQFEEVLDQLEEVGPRFDEIQEAIDRNTEQIEELRVALQQSNAKFDRAVLEMGDWRGALAKLTGHVRVVEQHATESLATVSGQLSEAVESLQEDVAEIQEACKLPTMRALREKTKAKGQGISVVGDIAKAFPLHEHYLSLPDVNGAAEILGVLPAEELDGAKYYSAEGSMKNRMAKIEAELKQQIHLETGEGPVTSVMGSEYTEAQMLAAGTTNRNEFMYKPAMPTVNPYVSPATGPFGANEYPHLPFGTDRLPQEHQALVTESTSQQQVLSENVPQAQPHARSSIMQSPEIQTVVRAPTAVVPPVTAPVGQMVATGSRGSFIAVPGQVPLHILKGEQQQQAGPGLPSQQFLMAEQTDGQRASILNPAPKGRAGVRSSIAQEGGLPMFPGA